MKTPKEIAEEICIQMSKWVENQAQINRENMFDVLEQKLIATITKDRETMLEALKARQKHGHNDTCDSRLIEGYVCNCGFDLARAAIAKATNN